MDLDDNDEAAEALSTTPTRALLWRTVFPSPHVKQILPVRKRDRHKTEILLVRDSSVDLVAFDPAQEALRKVATTASFPCGIRTAQALGDPRIVQNEAQHNQLLTEMPSIVLALGDLRLVYLRIVDAADGSIEFHYIQHPLLASDDPLHEPGYSLATESSARALAIAGSDGPIAVVALAVQSSDAAETTESELSVPVAASVIKIAFLLPPSGEGITALIAVVVGAKDGRLGIFSCVWDTDVPSNLENSKRSAHRLGNEHGLPSLVIPLKAPLHFMLVCDRLMAIYQLSTDGSLVQVHAVPLFDDSSAALDKSEDVSDTVVKPRWVSWARPVRRKDWAHEALYLASEDGHLKYVVIKASGAGLRIAEHSDAGKLDMNVGSAFAILDIPQADLEHGALPDDEDMGKYTTGYSDVFIAAGVHSDGGLYEIGVKNGMDSVMSAYDPLHFTRAAAHRPQKRQTLSNWGPLHSIVRSQGHRPQHHATNGFSAMNQQRNDGHHANHVTKDRLFGACGRAPSGSIVEFRFGIEASLRDGILFPSERIDLGGASNIFALSVHGKLPFFIVSYPWKSTWCSIETVPPNDSPAYLEHLPELDAPAQTLAAAVILAIANANDFIDEKQAKDGATKARRMVVQVTNSEIINVYFDRAEGKLCKVATLLFEKPTTATINARTGMILCISPSPSGCVLKLYEPSGKEILPSQSRQLDFICTAAAFLHPEGTSSQITHILLGTEAGSIELLEIVGDGQLQKKKRVLGLSSDDRGMGIESLGTVRGEEGCMFVLAGRRDGSIVVAQLGEDDKDDHEPTVSQVGDEPVSILGPLEGRRRILAISGNHIFAIDTPSTASGGHTQISEVFYTSPFDPAFRHGLLAGACIAEEAPGDYLAGRVIGLNGDGILCGVLDNGPKPVPIRTPVQGTPRLLASATDLQLLVYASTISHIDEEEGIRYSISTIFCMDPPSSQPQVKLEDGVADRLAFQISPGEEARCVAEMSMRVDEGTRSFILVGCSVLHEMDTDRGPRTVKGGSILWLKISRDSAGLRRISCSKRSEERGPVTALAPVNDASFVYASGRKVYGRSWNEETKRWPMRELQEMPSLVTAIRVDSEGGMLVTTAEHSTFVLQLHTEGAFMVTKHVAALDGPQKGLTHLAVGGPLILYSSSDGRVAGFSNTASSTGYEASYGVPASFEASLPVAINQLVRANTRPRYKRHQPKCVLRRDIIGTSLDGSMFSFSILEDNGYLLLKLVENMCHRHTKICPLALSAERHRPLEADREKPHELSINGNRLVELLQRRDAETIMKEMLDAPLVPGYYGSRPRDYERVEDRRRAAELLLKGLEEEASDDRRARQLSLERRILEYLIQVLEVPF